MIDINPAKLDQFAKGKNGKHVLIEADVGSVASDLQDIDSRLKVSFSEEGGYFVVVRKVHIGNGLYKEDLVLTALELDQRIVNRVRELYSSDYDYAEEINKLDTLADKKADHNFNEQVGEKAERLAHALRVDLGYKKDSGRSSTKWGKK